MRRASPVTRALVIAPTPFFGDRGCHVRILEEVQALARLDVESEIVTYPVGNTPSGVTVRRSPALPGIRPRPIGPGYGRPLLDVALSATALRTARRFRPHLVHAHLHEGIAIGALLRPIIGVPLVADIQGSLSGELIDHGFLSKGTRTATVVGRVERWLVGRPDRILASSQTAVELLLAQGVARDRVEWLPDGADLERFHPMPRDANLVRRFGLEGKRVVVFLGLLTEYQGVDTLLESLPLLVRDVPDAHFLIMGYPNEAWYRDRAKALFVERHVTLTGRIAYDDAARYLALGSVAVSPKTSPTEANGKLLNYMACGLPTVATDTAVNRELLGDAGIYVPIRDARALATALAGLLVDSDRQARIGGILRQRAVTDFSWPVLAGRLRSIYDELIPQARH